MAERSLRELNFASLTRGRQYFPSPTHWEDEIIYFLLVDRFSDNHETGYRGNNGANVTTGSTAVYVEATDNGNAVQTEASAAQWREAGAAFVGGTLAGIATKLGYLKRLGVTVIWISPVFRQVAVDESYHGYGIQNFLDIDPRFGTRDELKNLVDDAHAMGVRVILDIILNHAGDVFRYNAADPEWAGGATFPVKGFRDAAGDPTLPFAPVGSAAFPNGAIWPEELQGPEAFTRAGRITNFDAVPETLDGDFFSLKDLNLGTRRLVNNQDQIDEFTVSQTLVDLCQAYKFWIAFADIDGYRLDTVKHMAPGVARFFVSVIHEFAESLGKENFFLIGEITGGRGLAFNTLEQTGLDAALGIADERVKMIGAVKGEIDPSEYFSIFRNSLLVNKDSHIWFRDKIVTSIDDHDHVDQGSQKRRFCAFGARKLALAAMAMNATTLGIPCIYYGTEQLFDGEGGNDRYIREAMFGGEFGPFRSRGRHCFIESGFEFVEIAKIHALRRQSLPLRRGRQYLREISGDGVSFGLPRRIGAGLLRSLIPWSRIFNDVEMLCAINTDPDNATRAFVTIDNLLHQAGETLRCLYSTDPAQIGQTIGVEARNGKAVSLQVPPAGFVVYG